MNEVNHSMVYEFVFLGISSSWAMQLFLLVFSFVFYVAIVLGNFLIMFTVIFDPHLHSPMYLLLSNLSLIDLCFSSVSVPKMIYDLFYEHKAISFLGCLMQIFFIHMFGGTEMVLLISMAFDRYVAICKPLHYLTIMNPTMCILLIVGSWVIGLIHTLTQLAFVVNLPFCGPNEIDSFYCDLPRLIRLACADTYKLQFIVTANSGLISMVTLFLLFISYVYILVTVQKHSSNSLSKALSTLSAHITVVVLFFGPCMFVYLWPFPTMPVDKFLLILDFVITPVLNPFIYTFRNKEMKVAMRRLISQLGSSSKIL
ncbi:olfactory receptor 4F15-like [Trichosurus vulpecula]|uniref:olfactory receptor 4F15-like n=1 Tax=Trichosurus vulpecula TaxID=9337 RepID=UPI00186AE5F4|nr:olfactory receptor 4F15-like [Trichosurus vulpecula]